MNSSTPHDKVALVTGAGSGIGRACAQALLRDGWRVVFAGRRLQPLEEAIAAVGDPWGDIGQRALALSADVSDAAAVQRLFDTLQQRFGRLDLLFNNAGTFTAPTPLEELPLERWQSAVDVNLHGPFLCTQQAFRLMKQQSPRGGRIINNGSISAHVPRPLSAAYTITKHAISGLTRAAALEGRAFDIAVGQIDIGNVATDMTELMAQGALQADGSVRSEPRMRMDAVVSTFLTMARLPLEANVLTMTVMATGMPYVGRG
ncbi:SDR family oxidoreductase [uncultured Azohydromonas sp.]|jgi:Dehydrogenases with different specificities (related to short-chain alcohol dehydrogenases)|uniref:SDR family oxidoreductase n=1 Tax=uncultured Azohydromonas sp. TaxID=487342 RepID=UPI0026310486|nr:SDR family oxidoreductase [uncultured Azohydromonas sp.]